MSHAKEQPGFDLDEDLFDFAGVAPGPEAEEPEEDLEEILASFRDASLEEDLLAFPAQAQASAPAAEVAPPVARAPELPRLAPVPVAAPGPAAAAPAPAPLPVPAAARAPEPVVSLTPAPAATPAPSRLSKGVVGIALAVTLLNSVLALVAVRGREAGLAPLPAPDTGAARDEHSGGAHAGPPRDTVPDLPDPDSVDALHAHPTLDEARAQIARGEYAGARQRVYGLLAIIDRLPEPRRGALEADCQFLIAQSLHLEALARMGDER